MTNVDHQSLMAYVDNELDDKKRVEIEAIIDRDPEAAAIVERLTKSRELLKEGFDEILDYPAPDHLVATIRNHRAEAKIISHPSFSTPKNRFSSTSLALAASIALIIGVVAGYIMDNQPGENSASFPVANLLQQTLESQPSGTKTIDDNAAQAITPILTFAAENGQICREYERQSPTALLRGVACRNKEGKWITFAEIDSTLLPAPPTTEIGYAPAAGNQDPLSAALTALGAQRSFTANEEQQLRERGWQ